MPRRRRVSAPTWLWLLGVTALVAAFAAGWWMGRDSLSGEKNPVRAGSKTAAESAKPSQQPPTSERRLPSDTAAAPNRAHIEEVKFALVIDDLGYDDGEPARLEGLGIPLTYSVLPYTPYGRAIARRLSEQGQEVLCHLPMQPDGKQNPGPGALLDSMSSSQLEAATRSALDAVPDAVGANNHMGSELTSDPVAMAAVMKVLKSRGLFFLDSRTAPTSVGYSVAREFQVPALKRQVFLDDEADASAIREQFQRAVVIARRDGSVIAIGHPRPETLEVLRQEIDSASTSGVRFVRVSALLSR